MMGSFMMQWAAAAIVFMAAIGSGGKTEESSPEKETAVAKQLAVMSRVLEKRLGEDLKNEIVTASMLQRGIEGYYVAGIGAMFFVDAKFAVVAPELPKAVEKPGEDDLWSRTEREIEGVREPVEFDGRFMWVDKDPLAQPIGPPYDAKKVERLKTALFDVLAQYGKRLDAVADSERIAVIVSGGGLWPMVAAGSPPEPAEVLYQVVSDEPAAASSPTATVRRIETRRTSAGSNDPFVTIATAGSAPPRRASTPFMRTIRPSPSEGRSVLVISILKRDLADEAKALPTRARIEAYCY